MLASRTIPPNFLFVVVAKYDVDGHGLAFPTRGTVWGFVAILEIKRLIEFHRLLQRKRLSEVFVMVAQFVVLFNQGNNV